MVCPHCGATAAVGGRCPSCQGLVDQAVQVAAGLLTPLPTELPPADDATRLSPASEAAASLPKTPYPPAGVGGNTRPTQGTAFTSAGGIGAGPLAVGQSFGSRYHIIRLLGVGGMGAVYQAWDDELGVAVAIKVIRPEVMADPIAAADLARRFKRELLLARQVTHKNVVRIHDLGEIDGIKYLSMPFIAGQDLATLLKSFGKLPIPAALRTAKQIACGLQAAHEAGVVHRDLKPANIMVEDEHAVIMDFGIARSTSGGGGTMLGAVVGTLEYMAPEQARAEPVDQRADVYAFGLIFYDMLVGRRAASRPESAVAELMERMQHAPRSPRTIDPHVPEAIDAIVTRCLQPDAASRYQTTTELVADLEALDADGHPNAGRTISQTALAAAIPQRIAWWKWAAAAAVMLGVVAGGFRLRDVTRGRAETSAASGRAVSLAILPFRNASGDQSLDWLGPSLVDMLRTEVGQTARFRTVPPERVHQLLRDLRIPPGSTFDPASLRRLAEFGNADAVLWGQYVKFGNEIRIDATLEDLKRQQALALKAQAPNQGVLMAAIGDLAVSVRDKLALPPDIVKELQGKSLRPSTASFEALRYYNEGLQLGRQGKYSDALKSFEAATKEDANFALAHSKLAQTYASLGYDDEAERFSRRAVELSEALPPHEKLTIRATHARIVNNTTQAIEVYETLAKASPDDTEVHMALAELYEGSGEFVQARDHLVKVLELDPKYGDALLAIGRVETRRGNPQGSLEYLNQALSLSIQVDNDEARARILQAIGVSYKRLNKPAEALRHYRDSLEIKRRLGQKSGMAASLSEIAQMETLLGRPPEAEKAYSEALALRREIGDKRGTGDVLLNLGSFHAELAHYPQALKLFKEALQIQREIGNQANQALCLNNIGFVYLSTGQYEDALTYFDRALGLREKLGNPAAAAETLHNLALTWSRMGQFDDALKHHLRALELWRSADDKWGAAIEQYRMAGIFEYQGRYGAALKAKEEALKTLTELQAGSLEVAEVRSGYGSALSQVGRFEDARRELAQALKHARELAHKGIVAQTLIFQGDDALYRADFKAARARYEEALKLATATNDRALLLSARASEAKTAVREGRPQAGLSTLQAVAGEADRLGLRYLAIDCGVSSAEALLQLRRPAEARAELQRSLGRSERLGLRVLLARTHFLLAEASRAAGGPADEAARHATRARALMLEVRTELGSDDLFKREDLKTIR